MTVSYQSKVASSTSAGFTRLLFMWKGSLYKLIYRELIVFLLAFDILSVLYRNLFTGEQKRIFEKLVTYCDTFISLIPLTFILGFYVAYVAARWWQQYEAIPWPDKVMHTIALYMPGNDEHIRIVRRTLMRYLNLSLVLILRSISSAVKKRFPTMDHLTDVGFMTVQEKQMFLAVPSNEFNTYWIPCTWFIHVLKDFKEVTPKLDSQGLKLIMEEFNCFRGKCGLLWSYDWISIPLVYTQVVTLATYSFFIAAVVGRQFVEHSNKPMQMEIDVYLPVFTILQFFFFMGLLKVAEQLINPFGDDDEDFELNWLIDRHTKVSYLGVDTLMLQRPPLVKDKFYDDDDIILPYTGASFVHKKRTYRGSVHNMYVPEDLQNMYLPEIIEELEKDGYLSSPKKSRKSSCNEPAVGDIQRTFDDKQYEKNQFKTRSSELSEEVNANELKFGCANQGKRDSFTCPPSSLSTHITESNINHAISKIIKHNSLTYPKRSPDANINRRSSISGLNPCNDHAGYLSRWTSRRDSTTGKGIRWKPFPKHEVVAQNSVRLLNHNKLDESQAHETYTYINEAYMPGSKEDLSNPSVESTSRDKDKKFTKKQIIYSGRDETKNSDKELNDRDMRDSLV